VGDTLHAWVKWLVYNLYKTLTMKDLKYFFAYTGIVAAFVGLYYGGWWSFGITYIAFGIIPFFEQFIPISTKNHDPNIEEERSHMPFFNLLLYVHVPFIYAILGYAFYKIQYTELGLLETVGMIFNVGIVVGAYGINVGHELGHRTSKFEQFLSKALLLPALYQHFFIEHNRGHHKNVATDLDPASARMGENLYAFWFRSVKDSYFNAWKIENEQLRKEGKTVWRWQNEMLRFHVYQMAYLFIIQYTFGTTALFFAVGFAIVGFLLLETVNYIEHYGLRRKQLSNGRYEPVLPVHSWNSDHELGRIFLYELTRHSDHHYKATRKYQVLRHFDESPQLPFGYPLSMLVSLVPPLWFKIMDKRVPNLS
jgi:alkane 1-monooxygenase